MSLHQHIEFRHLPGRADDEIRIYAQERSEQIRQQIAELEIELAAIQDWAGQ